jgi:hypothetical protein
MRHHLESSTMTPAPAAHRQARQRQKLSASSVVTLGSMCSQPAYRLGDGAPVAIDSALAIWAVMAREVLEENRRTAPMPHSELARQVQQRSGVYTRMPATEWLPGVIADLGDADLAARVRADAVPSVGRAKTAAVRRPPAAARAPKRQEAPPAICPTCFMQLPASGRCDTCA